MPLNKAWDTRRHKRKAVAARGFQEFFKVINYYYILIFIILNQTKFRTREGAFDISVFPWIKHLT